jgi:hypothetical protein
MAQLVAAKAHMKTAAACASAAQPQGGEFSRPAYPRIARKTGGRHDQPPDYGIRRLRPFARRALMILRPSAVAMRARKPCVRARLSLLGWKVRFMAYSEGNVNKRSQSMSGRPRGCQIVDRSPPPTPVDRAVGKRVDNCRDGGQAAARLACPSCAQAP